MRVRHPHAEDPKDIVDAINAEVGEALRLPALRRKLSAEIFGGSV
jgi:hypothetical protein